MPASGPRARIILTSAAVLLGCVALAARPPAAGVTLIVLVAIGAIGAIAPVPRRRELHPGIPLWTAVAGLGIAAFTAARVLMTPIGPPATLVAGATTVLAAVSEEMFFRRLVYGWLAAGGVLVGVVGAAVLFAAVHIPGYGVRALPLDLAAGIVFGWQRWATGGWIASGLTHATANLLQML